MQFLSYKFACVFEFELRVNMLRAHSYIVLIFSAVNYCVARIGRKINFAHIHASNEVQTNNRTEARRILEKKKSCNAFIVWISIDENSTYELSICAPCNGANEKFALFEVLFIHCKKPQQLDAIHSTNVRRPETEKNPLKFGKWLSSCCWCKKR